MEEKAHVFTKNNVHIAQIVTVQAYVSIGEESQDACNATVLKFVFTKELSSTAKNVEAPKYVSIKD